jgi:hypothetical protein
VAGGAQVVATYLVGEAEARELVDELGSSACRVVRYDARAEPLSQLGDLSRDVHQLYYFATSQIFRDQAGLFDPARYREYAQIYVIGFEAICSALRMRGNSLTAFYPSSTAVDERVRGLTEYAMAKAAGEILCEDLCAFDTGLHILVKRLPRILTDQTATVVPVESATTLETMLPIVREMMALSSRTPV